MTFRVLLLALLITAPQWAAADGAELYATYCKQCHGENADMMTGGLASRARFQEVLEGVTEDMPDFYGLFEPEQVDALFEYVTSMAGQKQG